MTKNKNQNPEIPKKINEPPFVEPNIPEKFPLENPIIKPDKSISIPPEAPILPKNKW